MEILVDINEVRLEGNWQNMWGLKIPQRMKMFLWRAARVCLLTRQRLQQKCVTTATLPSTSDDRTPTAAAHAVWRPPGQGMYKCNVDAAIFKEQNCYGAGKCLRDERDMKMRKLGNSASPPPSPIRNRAPSSSLNPDHPPP
ncbi:hypothetical protein TSUD_145500 [Trifolium subterraneum]|uniref:Reverse transcriptase zinc-binding domain-containing protein n=1 Tax=Trifolium subterraneum TaxID=3900 RepID=A0A2Z6N182_TRISU|nr:hypothetical protein TSUD_145500 [Trifolium subterraneum]